MTAIHYPDLVAWSPNRVFRCEAVSPYNLPEWHPDRKVSPLQLVWPDAFQEEFEFTLYEGDSDHALWSVPQSRVSDVSPHELYVSDRGSCVVRTHGPFSAALVFLGQGGVPMATVDLLEEVFVGTLRDRVSHTTAGPFWARGSHAYFPVLGDREHFCVRTWWGDRLLFDVAPWQRLADGPFEEELATHERAWTLATLRSDARQIASFASFPEDAQERRRLCDVQTAIVFSGRLGVREAEPCLRALETTVFTDGSMFCRELFNGVRGDLGRMWHVKRRSVRILAAQALLRLENARRGFANYAFERDVPEGWVPLEVPEFVVERDRKLCHVSKGATALAVLGRVGAPDFVPGGTSMWEYDLEEDDATLQLHLDRHSGLLVSVERSRPAGWRGPSRERRCLGL